MKMSMRMGLAVFGLAAILAGLILRQARVGGVRDANALRAAFDAEFLTRPDGYLGLREHYGMTFASEPKQMDPGLMYRALADGAVDVIDGFATDGRIPAYDLVTLEDDRGFFPPYHAAPLIRNDTLRQHPRLAALLGRLAGRISDDAMQRLNFEADEKGRRAADIARAFLVEEGLIDESDRPGSGSSGRITIGSKHFTEQEILGEILATLIECRTDLRVRRRLNLGGTMICFNALRAGDLDVYVEYTGTGWVNILDREVIPDPGEAFEAVKTAFAETYDLVWLEPLGFNNTYTLTMRSQHAETLGIRTLSDLAAYLNRPGF